MSHIPSDPVAVIGIDIGKYSFHVVGLNDRGAIVLRQKWSRGQVEARLANMQPCLIGMEACVGAHHLSRKLKAFGHDARLINSRRLIGSPSGRGYILLARTALCITAKQHARCLTWVIHAVLPCFSHVGSAPDRVRIPEMAERPSVPQPDLSRCSN